MINTKAPVAIRMTCLDWFDGEKSAMWAVYKEKAFNPNVLLKEVRYCLTHLVGKHTDIEKPKLQFVEKWALEQI